MSTETLELTGKTALVTGGSRASARRAPDFSQRAVRL